MEAVMPVAERLAVLLEYPGCTFARDLEQCRTGAAALDASTAAEFERFADRVKGMPLAELQELYTAAFDLNTGCTLDMGWHLFGDRPQRGMFLADLRSRLAAAGVDERGELPDHLPRLLTLLARIKPEDASPLCAMLQPAVEKLSSALSANGNPYAHLVKSAFTSARSGA